MGLIMASLTALSGTVQKSVTIKWNADLTLQVNEGLQLISPHFVNAAHPVELDYLPEYQHTYKLNSSEIIVRFELKNVKTEPFEYQQSSKWTSKNKVSASFQMRHQTTYVRKQPYAFIGIVPIRKSNSGQYEKLISADIILHTKVIKANSSRVGNQKFANSSVLSSGDWYKIGITKDAVYKISYKMLESFGLTPSAIDPRTIRIHGNGGGMLPEKNSIARNDDLVENAIQVVGEADGSFDPGDYILFYGKGPHPWKYNAALNKFEHENNFFSDTAYYFLTFSGSDGKRISNQNSLGSSNTTVTSFDSYYFHEEDRENIIKSGSEWYGEKFEILTSYSFNVDFANVDLSAPMRVDVDVAAASKALSTFTVTVGGSSMKLNVDPISGNYATAAAFSEFGTMSINPPGNRFNVKVDYNKPLESSIGWLNYIEINGRRKLVFTGNQMSFRDLNSVGSGNISQFVLTSANAKSKVWDVTDHLNPKNQVFTRTGSQVTFNVSTDFLREFITFEDFDSTISFAGRVNNQNLHGLSNPEMIIVTHSLFRSAAERLAEFHAEEGLDVLVVEPSKIFNEFSSGARDIVAIRDFVRMFYERAGSNTNAMPRYLLFIGDGSYDNKNRLQGNTNFIPTYQSPASLNPTQSYVSDDYFGLLDTLEGEWIGVESVDIGIGRIPAQLSDEAEKVVDKIIRYSSPEAMGDWRNTVCFVADDEDGRTHMLQADGFAKRIDTVYESYNIKKIYFDAYKQESTPGGQRYPDAKEAINQTVQSGALIVNYTGHGGETGWAHERVLEIPDISSWGNQYELPLFVTATCEFSRFDDPDRIAGGERVIMNPDGGGIALLTTVRLVYSGANARLNNAFYERIFEPVNGEMPRLGDVFRDVKNAVEDQNSRNFTLLGDPAVRLNYPRYAVNTVEINGAPTGVNDTIRAYQKVTIKGTVTDNNGNKLSNFNGLVYPTVFDKPSSITTLNNDNDGLFGFNLQNNKLFRGRSSAVNGEYEFTFIVPEDIVYDYGKGKLSYYADDRKDDGTGYYREIVIGGTDPNAPEDNQGPQIELYLNDESWISGGITDRNPILIAKVNDENGINMVGTGIGHDIVAILDDDNENAFNLNDYYQADTNSYQSGKIQFPFSDLEPGKHKLKLRVWDVYNNPSEALTEFIVNDAEDISLEHVLNYPNPFTTYTEFWFEHNHPGNTLDVKIQIFTISGKIVKTIDRSIYVEGYNQNRVNPIVWDGRDDFGDKLGRGTYMYKMTVRSRLDGSIAEKLEKLLIL